jgi:hypothetical protein
MGGRRQKHDARGACGRRWRRDVGAGDGGGAGDSENRAPVGTDFSSIYANFTMGDQNTGIGLRFAS